MIRRFYESSNASEYYKLSGKRGIIERTLTEGYEIQNSGISQVVVGMRARKLEILSLMALQQAGITSKLPSPDLDWREAFRSLPHHISILRKCSVVEGKQADYNTCYLCFIEIRHRARLIRLQHYTGNVRRDDAAAAKVA